MSDAEWRKQVKKVFNRTASTFPTLRLYNDYLEDVECMIFSLAKNDSDAPSNKARLKAEADANAESIQQRMSVQLERENDLVDRIKNEGLELRKADEVAKRLSAEEAQGRENYKRQMNEVAVGDRDDVAKEVKEAHKRKYKHLAKAGDAADGNRLAGDYGVVLGMTNIVKVSILGGQLKSKYSVDQLWSHEGREKRMLAAGAIVPHSKEQQDAFWAEAMGSLFLEPRGN